MISKRGFFAYIICMIVLIVTVGACFCVFSIEPTAFAKTEYSDVLDDLKKDSSFDAAHYPAAANDNSLKVIQLGESVDKELFIYVYQPSKKFKASSINISRSIDDAISPRNYKLELLNSSGVFFKYIVKDFTVSEDPTRYYVIPSIFRPYDADIDKDAGHGNTVTEVPYEVAKQYCFGVINGNPYCNVVDIETIVVTDKFVGFVRYSDGFVFMNSACDSHFVAFNTDRPIDKLFEADVYYTKQTYTASMTEDRGLVENYGSKEDSYAYPIYSDKVEHTGAGLFAGTYTWDRIETVEQFIAENDLTQNVYSGAVINANVANHITDEGRAALEGKKWVLRFAETPFSYRQYIQNNFHCYSEQKTIVGDVTILRLKFETDGITYNLGVIDNKQTGSGIPVNDEELNVTVNPDIDKLKRLLLIVVFIILLILLLPLLPYVIKLIVWIVTLPFKLLASGIRQIKKATKKRE